MIDFDKLADLRDRAVRGRFYAMYHEYDDRTWPDGIKPDAPMDPTPVHPVHGRQMCPPVDLIEIVGDGLDEGTRETARIHIHQGAIHAGASWESPLHPDNVHSLALAEYIAELLNAAPELIKAARGVSSEGQTP